MQNANHSQKVLLAYSALIALCCLLIITGMFLSPSEPGRSILLGLSLSRLILVAGFVAAAIIFAGLFFKAFRDEKWAVGFLERWFNGGPLSRALAWIAGIGFGLGWVGCFLPAYRAGLLGPHWNRIQPVMVFVLVLSTATLAVFALRRGGSFLQALPTISIFRLGFVFFLLSLFLLGITILDKYPAHHLEDYWYGAGVPLLVSQLMVSLLAGLIFLRAASHLFPRRTDLAIAILLYGVTAILWAREPLQRSFMFIGPIAPNKVLYPFADGAMFDTASQFGLIGQGIYIFNTPFFERTLYLSFLIYLHTLVGQDYPTLMTAQAVIFAVFPVILYLIGRSLNMRSVGLTAALIALFRGVNAIAASNMIDLAGPKLILTDFPTAIGVALLVLFLCEWLKDPDTKWRYGLWTGGAIGLSLMLRTNALIFLPLIPLYAFFRYFPKWKQWILASGLMVLAVIAITLPWELRNASRGAVMYSPIITKIQNVLKTRYSPSGSLPSPLVLQQVGVVASLYHPSANLQEQACESVTCFAPRHFLHALITSVLFLPTSPTLDDLRHTVRESNPYWRPDWDGRFAPDSLFFFTLNLFLIALGVSVAWQRQRLSGLAPLAVFLFYHISNAFARTSGGRYVVPVDWIMAFYFAAGLLFLLLQVASIARIRLSSLYDPADPIRDESRSPRKILTGTLTILLLLFAFGSPVPLAEKLNAPRYANFDFTTALQDHEAQISSKGLSLTQINSFMQSPGAEMLVGRTLYPRSYKMGQGEVHFYPYTKLNFPRTGFVLIGPKGEDGILLPGPFPKYFPHASDVLVIGCRGTQPYIDALAVIFLDDTGTVYTRWPASPLACPLKQPLCENNTVCQ